MAVPFLLATGNWQLPLGRINIKSLADPHGGFAAIFDPLDPAKDFLGVRLADAEGEHDFTSDERPKWI